MLELELICQRDDICYNLHHHQQQQLQRQMYVVDGRSGERLDDDRREVL